MRKKLLITGGAGFIGSNFIHYIIKNTDYEIVNLDALTYAGNLENLEKAKDNERYSFSLCDIRREDDLRSVFEENDFNGVINFAAESHVDRSILEPSVFIDTNVRGTLNLLKLSLARKVKRFLQISTDEVYGELKNRDENPFTENSQIKPNSPYAASKASSDLLALSFMHTYKMDVIVTRCSNNYGFYQFPEKLIPLMIYKALNNEKLPIYGDGMNIRDWIHVNDHSKGVLLAFEKGVSGNVYNIGSRNERTNIEIVKEILNYLGKDDNLIEFVKDRPGHDRRYSIDPTKIEMNLGFKPEHEFSKSLKDTINWYRENTRWVNNCISGEYKDYYNKNYKPKMEGN